MCHMVIATTARGICSALALLLPPHAASSVSNPNKFIGVAPLHFVRGEIIFEIKMKSK